MKPRKVEREQLTALLETDWDDVDELCTAVFDHVASAVLARDWWVVAAVQDGALTVAGPFATRNKAVHGVTALELRNGATRAFIRLLVTSIADMEGDQGELFS